MCEYFSGATSRADAERLHRVVHGRFRDECLNENEFRSIVHARLIIEDWRRDYNEFRSHKSLGNRTPEEYVRELKTNAPSTPIRGINQGYTSHANAIFFAHWHPVNAFGRQLRRPSSLAYYR